MKTCLSTLSLVAAVLVFAAAAWAQGPDPRQEFCVRYADLAVEQYVAATDGSCGPSPQDAAPWHADRNAHLSSCINGDALNIMALMRQRHDHLLNHCPQVAASMRCTVYSLETMAHVRANRDLGCGYDESEPRWTPGFAPHFDWCRGFQPPQWDLDARTATRTELIQQCRTANSNSFENVCEPLQNDDRCHDYACSAMMHQQYNEEHSCGFTGAGWHADYNVHYAWCQGQPDSVLDTQETLRRISNHMCRHREERLPIPIWMHCDDPDLWYSDDMCWNFAASVEEMKELAAEIGCTNVTSLGHYSYYPEDPDIEHDDIEQMARVCEMNRQSYTGDYHSYLNTRLREIIDMLAACLRQRRAFE